MKISDRERKLLVTLGILGALAAGRYLVGLASAPATPAIGARARIDEDSDTPGAGTRRARGKTRARPTTVAELELGALEVQPRDFAVGRDLFRFAPPPPPPPPPPPTKEELERRRREEEERLRRLEEERRLAAIPRPPEVTFKYLGSFGSPARRIAVFADEDGENLFNAREGEVLEGKFIVDRIGFESVDLKFVGFPETPARRLAIGGGPS
ncbi:MAG: hypothetical protein U0X73_10355 [Thermoanaerobaculia bacterium]